MDDPVPARVREYADQAVAYVQRALGVTLEYDSDTLPLLDHYLRSANDAQAPTQELVTATAGAYFGEVVRRRLGDRAGRPRRFRLRARRARPDAAVRPADALAHGRGLGRRLLLAVRPARHP